MVDELTLALLMARVLADDEEHAAPLDELTLIANLLHAGTDFHGSLTPPRRPN